MIDVYFTTVSKRKNSTLIPDFTGILPIECALKSPTIEETPSFLLHWEGGAFPYNYCRWDSHYYFVETVTFERNNLITVNCSLDVLATYKAEILASTQYVAFSSVSGGAWLPDRRLPVLANCIITDASASLPTMWIGGNYVLTVLGENGCKTYLMGKSGLDNLLSNVQGENADILTDIMQSFRPGSSADDVPDALMQLANVLIQTDLLGNAYSNAPACVRGCIWVPFAQHNTGSQPDQIYLGNYDTNQRGAELLNPVYSETVTVNIPWHFTDWRRAYCEDIYLYLPLVGIVNISSDQITQESSLTVTASYCYTDGCVAYEVKAGNQIIGTYGGNCAAQYPLGINQQASAGEIANVIASGISKTVNAYSASKRMPEVAAAGSAVVAVYETVDAAYSTNPSVIGGIGGGAGSKLDLDLHCISVAHDTVISPSDMAATMGVPTQKPLQLSNCSGYCECVNAHVAAPAHGDVLNQIDVFLNSGFYIE